MSLKDCIDTAVLQGSMTKEEADILKKRYDALAKNILSTGKAKEQLLKEIEAKAAQKKRTAYLTETARKTLIEDIHSYKSPKGDADIAMGFLFKHEHFGEAKYMDAQHLMDALNAESHIRIEKALHEFRRGWLTGDLKRTGKRVGNRKTQARMDSVVAELFGQDGKDDYGKALAKVLGDEMESRRVMFNDAGGDIPKLDKWGLPQEHGQEALLNYRQGPWVDYVMADGMLDRDRMLHPVTGLKMTDAELHEASEHVWKTITTDGFFDHEPSGAPQGKGALWKQRMDHRFLHFKDADAWLRYAKDFGNPDPYAAIMGHINRMNRDIAHMQTFGPNPEVLRNYAKDYIRTNAAQVRPFDRLLLEKTEALKAITDQMGTDMQKPVARMLQIADEIKAIREKPVGKKLSVFGKRHIEGLNQEFNGLMSRMHAATKNVTDLKLEMDFRGALDDLNKIAEIPFAKVSNPYAYANFILARADDMWAVQRGLSHGPQGRVANALDTSRNLITASVLGTAIASALSDTAFGTVRRGFTGVSRTKYNVASTMFHTLKYMGPEHRREAVRAGLILDSALHVLHQEARYSGAVNTRSVSGFLADRTIALQGLSAWTQAGKHAFGMSMQAMFADHAGTPFDALPKAIQATLQRHGIEKSGNGVTWNQIRKAALYEPKPGAHFLRPQEVAKVAGDDAARMYIAMILRETRYAVPEGTVRSRSLIVNARPDSIGGQLTRSGGQFKSFSMAVAMLHGGQIARELQGGKRWAPASYAGALLITSALLGGLAIALKDMASMKDPRRATDDDLYLSPEFWGAAVLQAGGLGILADFLFANVNRHGGSFAQTLAGPLADRVGNVIDLTVGNITKAAQGKKTSVAADTLKFVRMNTPVLSSLFYAKQAYNRILIDQLQKLIDKDAQASFYREITRAKTNYKQDFWWLPGEVLPRRAPDIKSIVRKH